MCPVEICEVDEFVEGAPLLRTLSRTIPSLKQTIVSYENLDTNSEKILRTHYIWRREGNCWKVLTDS